MPIRIKFSKTDELQFISHLDLNRTMKSVMLRAGIPIHYSEGFNPHPKIAFGLPLSVGAESVCEIMDFKSDTEMPFEEIKDRLNSALPTQIRVSEAYEPVDALSDIRFAEYVIESETPFDFSPLEKDIITVSKRTKKGYVDTDIRPMIKEISHTDKKITAVLAANPNEFLNPEYLAKLLNLEYYTIVRMKIFTDRGEFR